MQVDPTVLAARPLPARHPRATAPASPPVAGTIDAESSANATATRISPDLDVAVELGLRAKMETITREEPESGGSAEEEAVEVYEDGEEPGREDVAALAHRLPRAVDRAVHDATKPLLRGSNGLDHESRAALREMRRELRHTLHQEYRASFEGDEFDVSSYAGRAMEALEGVANDFSALTSSVAEAPEAAVPERLRFATERMSAMLDRMIESLRSLAPAEEEDGGRVVGPEPDRTTQPEVRMPVGGEVSLTDGVDLSA